MAIVAGFGRWHYAIEGLRQGWEIMMALAFLLFHLWCYCDSSLN